MNYDQSYQEFSKVWVQSLDTLLRNRGVLQSEDYPVMLSNIKEYQVRTLQELVKDRQFEQVDNDRIQTVVRSQQILHQLQKHSFDDSGLREIINELYNVGFAILDKYGLAKALSLELTNTVELRDAETKSHFDSLVDEELQHMVNDYKQTEELQLRNEARAIAEGCIVGLDRRYFEATKETGEERLHRLLDSIHQELQEDRNRRVEELSLFSQSKDLADYRQKQSNNLVELLNVVSDCVIRNNEKEQILAQKRRGN